MSTAHLPARRQPGALTLLCLLLTLSVLLFGYRSCGGEGRAIDLPAVSTTVRVPSPPQAPPPGMDPMAPALVLAGCPQRVRDMIVHLRGVPGWASRPGIRGGRIFRNLEGILPRGVRYREYDVVAGLPRTAERLVVSADKANFYWTRDHYQTFTPIVLP